MKSLCLIALTLGLTTGALAQSPSNTSPLANADGTAAPATVVKHSWAKERIGWEGDPFAGPVESFEDMRRRSVDTRRVERARGTGNIGEASKVEREMRAEQVIKANQNSKPPRYVFTYKVSVTNNSDKTIKEFDWDYVFYDAATGAEVGRRQFTGVEKIGPGKTKELIFQVPSPPTKTISVYALDKNERQGLSETAIVVRIVYADGLVWSAP
jgi:hypothetical protein